MKLPCTLLLVTVSASIAGADANISFTPESLRVPIMTISLLGPNGGAFLYRCKEAVDWYAGREPYEVVPPSSVEEFDSCFLDLMNDAELEQKFGERIAEIPVGTYDTLYVDRCPPLVFDQLFFVKGQVVLDGDTWYTQDGPVPFTTVASKLSYARADGGGATNCRRMAKLAKPIVVTENGVTSLELFFIPQNIALAMTTSVGGPVCAYGKGKSGHTICVNENFELFAVSRGDGARAESYLITPDPADETAAGAVAELDLLVDLNDTIRGATIKYYFGVDTMYPEYGDWWLLAFNYCVVRLDGDESGYEIAAGNCDGSTAIDRVPLHFKGFSRSNHTGVVTLYKDGARSEVPYRAVRIP